MKKIIDCTLRDGGYHTKWNFKKEFLDAYFNLLKLNVLGLKKLIPSLEKAAINPLSTSSKLKTSEFKSPFSFEMFEKKELLSL